MPNDLDPTGWRAVLGGLPRLQAPSYVIPGMGTPSMVDARFPPEKQEAARNAQAVAAENKRLEMNKQRVGTPKTVSSPLATTSSKDSTQDATLTDPTLDPNQAPPAPKSEGMIRVGGTSYSLGTPAGPVKGFNRGVLGEGGSTRPEIIPGTPQAMQALEYMQWLDTRDAEKRRDEMANLGLEQERAKTRLLPGTIEAENALKTAQAGLAGAQGGRFNAQAKNQGKTPEERAYADSYLPLRKYITEHYDDPGVGDVIESRAAQMVMEQYGPKLGKNLRNHPQFPSWLQAARDKAMEEFILNNQPAIQRAATGLMGQPLGLGLSPYTPVYGQP